MGSGCEVLRKGEVEDQDQRQWAVACAQLSGNGRVRYREKSTREHGQWM